MTAKPKVGDNYVLATGAAGAAQLALLDEVYGPDAARIMRALGLPHGGHVVDLGCGTGNTARWLACEVGAEGEVTGVDVSADQLAVATEKTATEGIRNLRFIEANVYDTGLPRDTFDLVHCRFVLCHLVRPMDAVREMAALAKPGGLVIASDIDVSGLASVPSIPAYERMREMFRMRGQRRGTDPTIGPKLPRMFLEAGLVSPEIAIIHPIYLRGERKRLWEYTLFESSQFMIEYGVCDQAELDRLAIELAAVAADETIAVAQAPMSIAWARKAER
ncbi:MAG: class I SAM-dependent methyltransferase [Dongiaceae bacterium]